MLIKMNDTVGQFTRSLTHIYTIGCRGGFYQGIAILQITVIGKPAPTRTYKRTRMKTVIAFDFGSRGDRTNQSESPQNALR